MRRAVAMAALGLLLAVAGCGVPTATAPEVLSERDLGVPVPLGPGPVGNAAPGPVHAVVFFVRNDRLVPVSRSVTDSSPAASLRALLSGPNEAESFSGLRSAISPDARLRRVVVEGDTATIDLAGEMVSAGGSEAVLAAAQLVYTATEVPGVTRVRFAVDGHQLEVLRADGTVSDGTVTRDDYLPLAPV